MADLLELYDLAEQHQTPVYWFDLGAAESLSLQMEDGSCAIAMDPWRIPTLSDEKVKLGPRTGPLRDWGLLQSLCRPGHPPETRKPGQQMGI